MNRYLQIGLWILLAPVLGLLQAVAGMLVPIISNGDWGNHDLHVLLVGLALIYGGAWFIPALLVADYLILRRSLSRQEVAMFVLVIAGTAIVVGVLVPGIMLMIGYPMTACAILLSAVAFRKPRSWGNAKRSHR